MGKRYCTKRFKFSWLVWFFVVTGPTAAGPGSGVPGIGNDVSKLLPTSLVIGVAAVAGVVVQALIF